MERVLRVTRWAAVIATLLWGCAQEPTEPTWDNPYDPANGGGRPGGPLRGEAFPWSLSPSDTTEIELSLTLDSRPGSTGFNLVELALPSDLDSLGRAIRVGTARLRVGEETTLYDPAGRSDGTIVSQWIPSGTGHGVLRVIVNPEVPGHSAQAVIFSLPLRIPPVSGGAQGGAMVVAVRHTDVPLAIARPETVHASQGVNDNPFDQGTLSLSVLDGDWDAFTVQQDTPVPRVYDNGCDVAEVSIRTALSSSISRILLDARPLGGGWTLLSRSGGAWRGPVVSVRNVSEDEVFFLDTVVIGGSGEPLLCKVLDKSTRVNVANSTRQVAIARGPDPVPAWVVHNSEAVVLRLLLTCSGNSSGALVDSIRCGLYAGGSAYMALDDVASARVRLADGTEIEGLRGRERFAFNLSGAFGGALEVTACSTQTIDVIYHLDSVRRVGSKLSAIVRPEDVFARDLQQPSIRIPSVSGSTVRGPDMTEVIWSATAAFLPLSDRRVVPREQGALAYRGALQSGPFESCRIDSVLLRVVQSGGDVVGDSVFVLSSLESHRWGVETDGLSAVDTLAIATPGWTLEAGETDTFTVRISVADTDAIPGTTWAEFKVLQFSGRGGVSGFPGRVPGAQSASRLDVTKGALSVSSASPQPGDGVLVPNGGDVSLMRLSFEETTAQESVHVDSLRLVSSVSGSGRRLSDICEVVRLVRGSTILGSTRVQGDTVRIAPSGLLVDAGEQTVLAVTADRIRANAPICDVTLSLHAAGVVGLGQTSRRRASVTGWASSVAQVSVGELLIQGAPVGSNESWAPGSLGIGALKAEVRSLREAAEVESLRVGLAAGSWQMISRLSVRVGGTAVGMREPDTLAVRSGVLSMACGDFVVEPDSSSEMTLVVDLDPATADGAEFRIGSISARGRGLTSQRTLGWKGFPTTGNLIRIVRGRAELQTTPVPSAPLSPGQTDAVLWQGCLRETRGSEALVLDSLKAELTLSDTVQLAAAPKIFAGRAQGQLAYVARATSGVSDSVSFDLSGSSLRCGADSNLYVEIRASLKSTSCGQVKSEVLSAGIGMHGASSNASIIVDGSPSVWRRQVRCASLNVLLEAIAADFSWAAPEDWGTLGRLGLQEVGGGEGVTVSRMTFVGARLAPSQTGWRVMVGGRPYQGMVVQDSVRVTFSPGLQIPAGSTAVLEVQGSAPANHHSCDGLRLTLRADGVKATGSVSGGSSQISLSPEDVLDLRGPGVFKEPQLDSLEAANNTPTELRVSWRVSSVQAISSLSAKLTWRKIGTQYPPFVTRQSISPAALAGEKLIMWYGGLDSVTVEIEEIHVCPEPPGRGEFSDFPGRSRMVGLRRQTGE